MAINDLYTAQFRFEGAGSGWTSSMAYRQTDGGNDENTLTDLAVKIALFVEDSFKATQTGLVDMTSVLVYQVTGTNETPGRTRFQQPNAGGVAGNALPMGMTSVISWLTDAPNAKHNGRMFIGGVPEDGSDDGQLTVAQLALMDTLIADLLSAMGPIGALSAQFEAVTISRVIDGIPRVPPVGFKIVSGAAETFVKNQRRRNTRFLGVGPATP